MKKRILIMTFCLFSGASIAFGQDVPQSEVPSLVVNSFQTSFPKATSIEWELSGDLYKVEFETGILSVDHDALYDKSGKLIKHKEEISKSDLPKNVIAKINSDFKGYRIEDVKKITEGDKIIYTLELKTFTEEWKVAFDAEGNVLSKMAD